MSCIVGIAHQGRVYLAGDSAHANDEFQIVTSPIPKVFRVGEFAIGCTGSVRVSQLLGYTFKPHTIPNDFDLTLYMVDVFVMMLKECLRADGQKEDNLLADSCLMVGVRERLFVIYNDFQLEEVYIGYNAIGSAANVALGSLHSTRYLIDDDPQLRLQKALEAATEHNASIRPPFVYVFTPEGSHATA